MNFEYDINNLIVRQLSGETSPEDNLKLENWISLKQENKDYYNELKDIWLAAAPENSSENFNFEKAICDFKSKVVLSNENKKRSLSPILKYAALFLLLLGIPLTYLLTRKPAVAPDNFTTVFCAFGDRTSIVLPDSSKVWLNSGSRITFNNNFNTGSRELFLEGEAYFAVKKDQENPFLVNTSDLTVKVLGTDFNMKAYPDEAEVAVTLVEGSLQVSNQKEMAMVVPRQKLNYDKKNQVISIENLSDLEPETEWTNGRLVFRNESLAELERKLERWFDVEIELSDEKVKSRRYSGTLERESILEVISYFASSQYVDYQIDGNEITFFSE